MKKTINEEFGDIKLNRFVKKSLDNTNEIMLRHTDDIYITCLGIQYDYTNKNGEKFSVIVSDVTPSKDRYGSLIRFGTDMLLNLNF